MPARNWPVEMAAKPLNRIDILPTGQGKLSFFSLTRLGIKAYAPIVDVLVPI